jgi:hypothetical protein
MIRCCGVLALVVVGMGCSSVVSNTLAMKDGDSGTPMGCTSSDECPSDGNPCNGEEMCVDRECTRVDPIAEGGVCMMGMLTGICMSDACLVPPGCGDGITQEPEEQCDDGANGNDEDGCTDECRYTCQDDGDCDDGFSCNGMEMCTIPGAMNLRRCRPGLLPGEGTACDVTDVFTGGVCRTMDEPVQCCRDAGSDECCFVDVMGEIMCPVP